MSLEKSQSCLLKILLPCICCFRHALVFLRAPRSCCVRILTSNLGESMGHFSRSVRLSGPQTQPQDSCCLHSPALLRRALAKVLKIVEPLDEINKADPWKWKVLLEGPLGRPHSNRFELSPHEFHQEEVVTGEYGSGAQGFFSTRGLYAASTYCLFFSIEAPARRRGFAKSVALPVFRYNWRTA